MSAERIVVSGSPTTESPGDTPATMEESSAQRRLDSISRHLLLQPPQPNHALQQVRLNSFFCLFLVFGLYFAEFAEKL